MPIGFGRHWKESRVLTLTQMLDRYVVAFS